MRQIANKHTPVANAKAIREKYESLERDNRKLPKIFQVPKYLRRADAIEAIRGR